MKSKKRELKKKKLNAKNSTTKSSKNKFIDRLIVILLIIVLLISIISLVIYFELPNKSAKDNEIIVSESEDCSGTVTLTVVKPASMSN